MDDDQQTTGSRRRRRNITADERARHGMERQESAKLPCPMCEHNPQRYMHVKTGNCKSENGFAGIQNVIQHLIQSHLCICRWCKQPIKETTGAAEKTQRGYLALLRSHGPCIEREWEGDDERYHPEILTEKQQQVVLEYRVSKARAEIGCQENIPNGEKGLWIKLCLSLHEGREGRPNPDWTYSIPRHVVREYLMTDRHLDLAGLLGDCLHNGNFPHHDDFPGSANMFTGMDHGHDMIINGPFDADIVLMTEEGEPVPLPHDSTVNDCIRADWQDQYPLPHESAVNDCIRAEWQGQYLGVRTTAQRSDSGYGSTAHSTSCQCRDCCASRSNDTGAYSEYTWP